MIDFKGARQWTGNETFVHFGGYSQEALYWTLQDEWVWELRSSFEGLRGLSLAWKFLEKHNALDWLKLNGHQLP